jgi:phosphohistidine phosphatase SixA
MRWFATFLFFGMMQFVAYDVQAQSLSNKQLIDALRSGGHILLLRHAQTDPGIGDPVGFKLADCATQRNLSAGGRAQAQRMSASLRAQGVSFAKTLTSQWCRCRDTAKLISESVTDFAALNSIFENIITEPKQTVAVRAYAKRIAANESWLMVTHQVNISTLTGVALAMGEGVVVRVKDGEWKVLGALVM